MSTKKLLNFFYYKIWRTYQYTSAVAFTTKSEYTLTWVSPVTSLAADATTRHFQVGDTGSQVLERPSTWLSGRRLPSCRPRSSWLTVSRQYDAEHPSYDDFTGIQSICRRQTWTSCLEQPSSCHPWFVTVAVNLRKAAENLFVCLRVAALVTYELGNVLTN